MFYVSYPVEFSITKNENQYYFLDLPSKKKIKKNIMGNSDIPLWESIDFHGFVFFEGYTRKLITIFKKNDNLCLRYKDDVYKLPIKKIEVGVNKKLFSKSEFYIYSEGMKVISIKFFDPFFWIRSIMNPLFNGANFRARAWESVAYEYGNMVESEQYTTSKNYNYANLDAWKNWLNS